MSDTGDVPELQELESVDTETGPGAQAPRTMSLQEATLHQLRSGLPAPALNPRAGKEYYRFLLAGVVMLIGCMMPFGPEWEMAGYKTLSGALFTVIALGMVWTWWGAIHHNRFGGAQLKWVALALLPFLVQLFNLIGAFDAAAVRDYIAQGKTVSGWGELFSAIKESVIHKDANRGMQVENFFRAFGTGKVVVFLGALMAEVSFLTAVFGGAKKVSQQKQARQAAAPERRRR
jgi:hypothetical protein